MTSVAAGPAVVVDSVVKRYGRRAVVDDVRGDPDLTQPLSDPAGKRRMVLDHEHPHPTSMR